ncbi:Conserved_hypothetical protein [Hexamita inflata]|uniref:AAA+ ATPase domain-containing protein n=1 Tax=Hexamita inflata TaxID=28002 RepID=A0ABP1GSP5_9EUKA
MSNNLTSDQILMLPNCTLPISSFSFTGLFGASGSGKSTQLLKLSKAVIDWSKTTQYDLEKPDLCNGPISHFIYMSPTIALDNTLSHVNTDKRIDLEFTDENLLSLSTKIIEMNKSIATAMQFQTFVRTFIKTTPFKTIDELQSHPSYKILIQALNVIEKTKNEYPELLTKENDNYINNQLNKIFEFNKQFLRRPKIVLIIDDSSGSKLYQQTANNTFYKLIVQRRHLGIFFIGVSFHSGSNAYKVLKTQMNAILLFRGLSPKAVADMFDCVSALSSPIFDSNTFVRIYQQTTGYDETDNQKKEKYKFNFLYVQAQPNVSININYTEPV